MRLVRNHGLYSAEVVDCIEGNLGYVPNAFLKGFAKSSDARLEGKLSQRDFLQYVRDSFGGDISVDSLSRQAKTLFDIERIDDRTITSYQKEFNPEYQTALKVLDDENLVRDLENRRRSDGRIANEVDALVILKGSRISDVGVPISLLSGGTAIPRLWRGIFGELPKYLVMFVDGVYEVLNRLGSEKPNGDFRSLMTSEHFRLAAKFVDLSRYNAIIRPAASAYRLEVENLRGDFERYTGQSVEDYFADVPFHAIPGVVDTFGAVRSGGAQTQQADTQYLVDRIRVLEAELAANRAEQADKTHFENRQRTRKEQTRSTKKNRR